jgi:hypothetical protein
MAVQGLVMISPIACARKPKPAAQVAIRMLLTGQQIFGVGLRKIAQPRSRTVETIVAIADPWSYEMLAARVPHKKTEKPVGCFELSVRAAHKVEHPGQFVPFLVEMGDEIEHNAGDD